MRTVGGILCVALLAPAAAVAQAPAGPEFRVNTYTSGFQLGPSVAVDPFGGFVVAWPTPDGALNHLAAQMFDAAGAPHGTEFAVSDGTASVISSPDVAMDASGAFTFVWVRSTPVGDSEIRARRFDSGGAPRGPSFVVNSVAGGFHVLPAIASHSDGSFVVAWSHFTTGGDPTARGQRFDTGGNRLGAEFLVSANTTGGQWSPDVAMYAAGDFLIVWRRPEPGIVAGQRFTAGGARLGAEFKVNGCATCYGGDPRLAVAFDGHFLVVWKPSEPDPQPLLARLFDAEATPLGPDFLVSSRAMHGGVPAFSVNDRFLVGWDQLEGDGSGRSVHARWFQADGSSQGRPFRVNTATALDQQALALASNPLGVVAAAWMSAHQDGLADVFAQRHGLLGAGFLSVDLVGGAGSNGNGVLEPGETVGLQPFWENNTSGALDLAGVLTGLTGPPGATYTLTDAIGSYGTVAAGGGTTCLDCYAVAVSAPANRPSPHWDASVVETINPGDDGHVEWTLHVGDSFADVPRTHPFYRFVEVLFHHGVTGGCAAGAYCPASAVTREQMAPFLLVAREGAAYAPRACLTPVFADVPPSSPFCRWIEELARRGVTGGCGGGNFCPGAAVTREQMAVFVLRTLEPALDPPACTTPVFNDVPASSPFCRWIEELARRGIVSGCGGPNYCPTAPVTREQMAVFLTGTFRLTLYGL